MDWHSIHITSDENLSGKQHEIQNAYDLIVMAASVPKEFALFSSYNLDDGTIDIFVTPQLSVFADFLLKNIMQQRAQNQSQMVLNCLWVQVMH